MDFFRYLILHEYGGIYSDMDFVPTGGSQIVSSQTITFLDTRHNVGGRVNYINPHYQNLLKINVEGGYWVRHFLRVQRNTTVYIWLLKIFVKTEIPI